MPKKQIVRFVSLLVIVVAGLLLGDDAGRFLPVQLASPHARQDKSEPASGSRHSNETRTVPQHSRKEVSSSSSAIQGPIWTSTRTLTAQENADAHWEKHYREFPEYRSAQEYIEGAHLFLRGPPAGTEEKRRPNGDRLLYHAASNTFAVQAKSGAPRTMFRPRNGQRYWSRQ